ncbi:MAG: DUF4325 domain-containing protein [Eubacteriales bacterium]
MALSKENSNRLQKYILELIDRSDENMIQKVTEAFDISNTTVYNHIQKLIKADIITKTGHGVCNYQLLNTNKQLNYTVNKTILEEDRIYSKEIQCFFEECSKNIKQIWNYAFTEMMNNAIEHSNASEIEVLVSQNKLNTTIMISDNGVGIFEKIRAYYQYPDIETAILELFKGKLTTDSARHSGEGIFFTSRAVDAFLAISSGKVFTHTNYIEFMENLSKTKELKYYEKKNGTIIFMKMSNTSSKNLKEVFDMFSNQEDGFNKTQVPINQICENGYPVSRSQARRLSLRFEEFKEIILDFRDVQDIGQGFAHELFVVFQNNHPEVLLNTINCNTQVNRMICHVKASNK